MLRLIAPKLRTELKQVSSSVRAERKARQRAVRVEHIRLKDGVDHVDSFAMSAILEMEAAERIGQIAAAAIILVLNDEVQRLRCGIAPRVKPLAFEVGAPISSRALAVVVNAASNCFRHADEWESLVLPHGGYDTGSRLWKRASASIEVLDGLFASQNAISPGLLAQIVNTMASAGLSGRPDYERMESSFLTIARDAAVKYGGGIEIYEAAMDAVESMQSYANAGFEFS